MNIDFAKWLRCCRDVIEKHGTCLAFGDDIRPFPDLDKAYRAYVDALGRSVQSLSEQEKRQAVLLAVLDTASNVQPGSLHN